MKTMITPSEFKEILPKQLQNRVNMEVIDSINAALSDPDAAHAIRDNLIGYTKVLENGKYKLSSYVDAVKYVSYKMMGHSNLKAYVLTFPDRYNDMVARGVTKKDMSSYVAAYNKNKLVNLIYEQTLIPTYILNADAYQEAINTQVDLMRNSQSDMVKTQAANSILNHIKRPEEAKLTIDVTHKESNELTELKELTRSLAAQMANDISTGSASPKQIAEMKIINGSCEEVDND